MAEVNFLHFAFFLFVICSAVLIIVSLMTPAPDQNKIAKVSFTATTPIFPRKPSEGLLSLGLVVLILIVWIIFSPWGIGA